MNGPLHFNLALIEFIARHRNPLLTQLFLFFTFLGDTNGYILVITLIYVVWDKRLAVRLTVLLLISSVLNHLLKVAIRNPRPFVTNGTYSANWAVPKSEDSGLALDYSTPSGHAMCSASFYGYLISAVKSRWIGALSIAVALLIGLSRPYLGVHYVEDIMIGWAVGGLLAAATVKWQRPVSVWWNALPYYVQTGAAVIGSIAVCALSIGVNRGLIDIQPKTLAEYVGFLTGVVVAKPLEMNYVRFDPRSSSPLFKLGRYLISIGLVLLMIIVGGIIVHTLTRADSLVGYLLEYLRYVAAGIVSLYVAPLVFTKIGLCRPSAAGKNGHILNTRITDLERDRDCCQLRRYLTGNDRLKQIDRCERYPAPVGDDGRQCSWVIDQRPKPIESPRSRYRAECAIPFGHTDQLLEQAHRHTKRQSLYVSACCLRLQLAVLRTHPPSREHSE